MPELSIIVPIYNVEQYLPKCIESILSQSFADFELILVNDGSPDNSNKIMNEYASKDSRIVTVFQKNSGVSVARNTGISLARGEYIAFIDPDDWAEEDMFEKLIKAIKNDDADVAICAVSYVDENNSEKTVGFSGNGVYSRNEMLAELFAMPNKIGGGIWNKVYRKSVIDDVRFVPGIKMAEDLLFCYDSLSCCSKGIKIEKSLYNVLIRKNSATRNSNYLPSTYELLTKTLKVLLQKVTINSPELLQIAYLKYLDFGYRYIPNIKDTAIMYGQPYKKKVWDIKKEMLHIIYLCHRNKYMNAKRTLLSLGKIIRL